MHLFQTPFVRQNTPHPKELKAKAHKLFSKGKNDSRSASTDEQVIINFIFRDIIYNLFVTVVNNIFQDVSQTFGLDKTETDISTKSNDLTTETIEQESLKPESIENAQKETIPGIVADNADFQSSNEPEIILTNQYITESNAVSIYVNASLFIYLFVYLFIYLLICY